MNIDNKYEFLFYQKKKLYKYEEPYINKFKLNNP